MTLDEFPEERADDSADGTQLVRQVADGLLGLLNVGGELFQRTGQLFATESDVGERGADVADRLLISSASSMCWAPIAL